MEAVAGNEKGRQVSPHLNGPEKADRDAQRSTAPRGRHGALLRTMEAEVATLEQGADILKRSAFANGGPAMEGLGRALELLLRKEAARTRSKVRDGRSAAQAAVEALFEVSA